MHRIPFIRLTAALALGIISQQFLAVPLYVVLAIILVSAILTVCFAYLLSKESSIAYNHILGLMVVVCVFFTAYLHAYSFHLPSPNWPDSEMVMKLKVSRFPSEREKTYRIETDVIHYTFHDSMYNKSGKLLLYVSKEVDCTNWQPGDEVIVACKPNEINESLNPGEFNLKQYNARKGIYYRVFVKPNQILYYQQIHEFGIYTWFYNARKYLMSLSADRFVSPSEKALSDALVFGYQDDLDEETVSKFSKSGTSHVLAVSGLHIGILWLVMDKLLFLLNRNRSTRFVKFAISMGILWCYALLTGLSPSVMRAAIMFSGFAFAGLMKHRYISLNILFVSAAAQVIIEPMVIFNIGFQLSYSAVASILIFYKPIKNLLYLKNKYARLIWETTALTLAAQILTTPISLYWFGQFPVWFVFSNMILVPLSSVALIAGLLSFALIWLPYLNDLLFYVFAICIKLMDSIAAFFANLPLSLLYFNVEFIDAVFLYTLVLCISLFILKKKVFWFKLSLCVIACFLAVNLVNDIVFSSNKKYIAYQLKQGTVIRYLNKHHVQEYRNEFVDKKSYSYSVKPSDRLFDIRSQQQITDSLGFLSLGNKNIILLKDIHLKQEITPPVYCDWIVIDNMKYINFDKLMHNFQFKQLVIGNGNSWKSKQYWQKECRERNIAIYDLSQKGALIAD